MIPPRPASSASGEASWRSSSSPESLTSSGTSGIASSTIASRCARRRGGAEGAFAELSVATDGGDDDIAERRNPPGGPGGMTAIGGDRQSGSRSLIAGRSGTVGGVVIGAWRAAGKLRAGGAAGGAAAGGRPAGVVAGALRAVGDVPGDDHEGGVSVCVTRTDCGGWFGGMLVRDRGKLIDDDDGARTETGATSIELVTTRRIARSG